MDFLCICLVCDSVYVFMGVKLESFIYIGSSSTFFDSLIGLLTISVLSGLDILFSGFPVPILWIACVPAD